MKKHYDLKKMRRREKPSVASPRSKVPISVRLDLEILSWLQRESVRSGIPYQTLLNAKLRECMAISNALANPTEGIVLPRLTQEQIRQIFLDSLKAFPELDIKVREIVQDELKKSA